MPLPVKNNRSRLPRPHALSDRSDDNCVVETIIHHVQSPVLQTHTLARTLKTETREQSISRSVRQLLQQRPPFRVNQRNKIQHHVKRTVGDSPRLLVEIFPETVYADLRKSGLKISSPVNKKQNTPIINIKLKSKRKVFGVFKFNVRQFNRERMTINNKVFDSTTRKWLEYGNLEASNPVNFGLTFGRTLIVAIFVCIFSTLLTLFTSYAFSRCRFKSRQTMMKFILVIGMFPGFISLIVFSTPR